MANVMSYNIAGSGPMGYGIPSHAAVALDSAYLYDTTGDAIALRFMLPAAKTLVAIHYRITARTGAPGAIQWSVRVAGTSVAKPGAYAQDLGATDAVGTDAPSAVTPALWRTITLTGDDRVACPAGVNFLCMGNTDGVDPTLNHVTVMTKFRPSASMQSALDAIADSTNGFNTGNSAYIPAGIVAEFSDGTAVGGPYVAVATTASSQNQRGLKCQFDVDTVLLGIGANAGGADISTINVYADGNNPDGTKVLSEATSQQLGELVFKHAFAAPPTLLAGGIYRIVLDYSGNATYPSVITMGAGTVPDGVKACRHMHNSNW